MTVLISLQSQNFSNMPSVASVIVFWPSQVNTATDAGGCLSNCLPLIWPELRMSMPQSQSGIPAGSAPALDPAVA